MAFPLGEVVLPHYYGKIVDKISSNPSDLYGAIQGDLKMVVILWLAIQAFGTVSNRLDSYMIPKLQSYVRQNLVVNVLNSFKENYHDLDVGALISRVIKLPFVISDVAYLVKSYIVPTVWILLVASSYFFYIDAGLGLVSLFGMSMFVYTIYNFTNSCMFTSNDMDENSNDLHNEVGDVFKNLMNIYAANTVEQEVKRFEQYQETLDQKYTDTIKCSSTFKKWFSLSYLTLFVLINGYSLWLYSHKKVGLQEVTSTLIVSLYLVNHLKGLGSEIRDYVYDIGVLSSTQNYLNGLSKVVIKNGNEQLNVNKGNVSFSNIGMKYGNNVLFKNINLDIPAGQRLALVGKIGSGKTSLVQLLMKLKPHTGKIYVDGKELDRCCCNSVRQQITYVPQLPTLFQRSIYENIIYGSNNISKQDVKNLIRKLDLDGVFGEHSLDTVVGKDGAQLSGGQQRTIFLLRCLLRDNKILILDEPTTSLDKHSKIHIMNILKELMKGKTVIMITHDEELLQYVDRVVTMHKGEIIDDNSSKGK